MLRQNPDADLPGCNADDQGENDRGLTVTDTKTLIAQPGTSCPIDFRLIHLIKDRDALLAFYDFPAEHCKHLCTTNVIESSFATVRHRTVRSKGCLSNKTALTMIFKLAEAAEKNWRRLDGHNQLPKLILGVKFADGIEVVRSQAQAAAASSLPSPTFGDSSADTRIGLCTLVKKLFQLVRDEAHTHEQCEKGPPCGGEQ